MKKNLIKTLVISAFLMINAAVFAQCVIPITEGQSYTENFDNGTMECWTVEATGAGTWGIMTGTATNVAAFQGANVGDEARLISPTFDMSGVGSATLGFTYAMMALYDNDVLTVSYRTSENDVWHDLDSYSINDWSNVYEASYDLPDITDTYQISFLVHSNGGYYVFVDNIEVMGEGGCPRPVSFQATEITAHSALLSWSTTGNEESWEIIDPDFNSTIVNEQPYLMEGLEPYTNYTFRVRANCVGGLSSDWSYQVVFRTMCDVITVTDDEPYFDDFESSEEFVCWQNVITMGEFGWAVDPEYLTQNNAASFFWMGIEARLVSVTMDITAVTNPTLTFRHKEPHNEIYADEFNVWYRTSPSDSWHFLASYTGIVDNWMDETIILPNPSATYQISFKALAANGNSVYVDDVRVGNYIDDGLAESQELMASVMPNPTNGKITVSTNLSIGNVAVFDMLGKQVMTDKIVDGIAEFDLSELTQGVYFIKISDESSVKTVKIVKN
ncbi:MAG: T9SS type A sorting domain-containing protein [Bacteroidales bacterium]|nr:T9SS type A sorting domain-containing protein [Bacteroidales bacterium]